MIKIGVLGAGHLGKIHLKLIKQIPDFELVGFFDPDEENAHKVATDLHTKAFDSLSSLMNAVDAIDIVTPTLSHFECAMEALAHGKHIFIEKPMTNTVKEATQLLKHVQNKGVKAQVGHVERFNPAFLAIKDRFLQPLFIEAHRLAAFNPRGTDVPVVLDLMVHDLDIILHLVKSPVKQVSASGVTLVSESPDIANARIEFENGCVVNITASRISLKPMRKMRIFQHNAYIGIDFLKKTTKVFKLIEGADISVEDNAVKLETGDAYDDKYIAYEELEVGEVNAIKMELELFASSIINDSREAVTVEEGAATIKLAHAILDQVEKRMEKSTL